MKMKKEDQINVTMGIQAAILVLFIRGTGLDLITSVFFTRLVEKFNFFKFFKKSPQGVQNPLRAICGSDRGKKAKK